MPNNKLTITNKLSEAQDLHDIQTDEEGSSKNNWNGIWDITERIVKLAASLGVLFVAVMAYVQYQDANSDIRKNRSLELVSEWNNRKFPQKFANIAEFIESKRKLGGLVPAGLPESSKLEAMKNLARKWVREINNNPSQNKHNLFSDLDMIILFFSRMEICVSSNLCDQGVLKAYFESELISFWNYFRSYAEVRREHGYAGYGLKVDALYEYFKARN